METTIIEKVTDPMPEIGAFYRHYKFDPAIDSINHHAYQIVNIGHDTEKKGSLNDSALVIYRPLYEQKVYLAGGHYDVRPLGMFMEKNFPDINNNIVPERFVKITDENVIAELKKIRDEMYK